MIVWLLSTKRRPDVCFEAYSGLIKLIISMTISSMHFHSIPSNIHPYRVSGLEGHWPLLENLSFTIQLSEFKSPPTPTYSTYDPLRKINPAIVSSRFSLG